MLPPTSLFSSIEGPPSPGLNNSRQSPLIEDHRSLAASTGHTVDAAVRDTQEAENTFQAFHAPSSRPSASSARQEHVDGPAKRIWSELCETLDTSERKLLFSRHSPEVMERSANIQKLLLQSAEPSPLISYLEEQRFLTKSRTRRFKIADLAGASKELLFVERKVRMNCLLYRPMFPSEIWHCCRTSCFASILINPSHLEIVGELRNIHCRARRFREEIENISELVRLRRPGVGGTTMAYTAPSRSEWELLSGQHGTNNKSKIAEFSSFVETHLPYLYGKAKARNGSTALPRKVCTEAISLLLSISRCFLYHRKRFISSTTFGTDPLIGSLIDTSGLRQRQLRRIGSRKGFPAIYELPFFECGCPEPCFSGVPTFRLEALFKEFLELSNQIKPHRKENQFLLNVMFCLLLNTSVQQCTRSLSKLYTVSENKIGPIRIVLDRICSDPSLSDQSAREKWINLGYTYRSHPIRKYDAEFRSRIENHLDMVLRHDPAGGEGFNVARVYSIEVNTHQKLAALILSFLKGEKLSSSEINPSSPGDGPSQPHESRDSETTNEADLEATISASTVQRIINEYLSSRNLRMVFQQTDHNACPSCKAMQYSVTQYHYEFKCPKMKLDALTKSKLDNPTEEQHLVDAEMVDLERRINEKKDQEMFALESIKGHTERDRDIRKFIKSISDHFRQVENRCINERGFDVSCPTWNQHYEHAIITHQDDMTKVDLPYFVQSASADITRWRFDVNAHVSSVNGDGIVFSHEQGSGSKNASCIIEEIILDHVLRSRGEGIKVIVSDNASVGKNWLSTVTLPKYLVDQGLAEIDLVIFFENNHGKWLADMLFGQLQAKSKRTTLLSVDDLLHEFESINRSVGTVKGFALNPLRSIDFTEVFASLGNEMKPPKEFLFTRRNINFAGACQPRAKGKLGADLLKLIGPALPEQPGMVRICTNPPSGSAQEELLYHDRYFEVPACSLQLYSTLETQHSTLESTANPYSQEADHVPLIPLAVPLDIDYSPSGNCVVETIRQVITVLLKQHSYHLANTLYPIALPEEYGLLKDRSSHRPKG